MLWRYQGWKGKLFALCSKPGMMTRMLRMGSAGFVRSMTRKKPLLKTVDG